MKPMTLLAVLAMTTWAGSAVAGTSRSAQRLSLVEQSAAAAVPSVRLTQTMSFETLADEHVLLWATPRNAFLLKLDAFCDNLASAYSITLDYHAPTLSARFDHVLVNDSVPGTRRKCQILEIRPVDVAALKAAQREARDARKAANPS